MPWVVRWEQAINRTILGDDDKLICKFNVASLMRGDATQRAAFYQAALGGARGETAYMTRNEVRELEDLNPIAGGDKLTMPPVRSRQFVGWRRGTHRACIDCTANAGPIANAFECGYRFEDESEP
jgi:hypothetical protein